MSNWGYVAIAYTVVWGSLAIYALLLARRVSQARKVAQQLRRQEADNPHESSVVSPASPVTGERGLKTGD